MVWGFVKIVVITYIEAFLSEFDLLLVRVHYLKLFFLPQVHELVQVNWCIDIAIDI